jgi:hypothetical protein
MSHQTDKNKFQRELDARTGELPTAFGKKFVSHMSKRSANTVDKHSKETGAIPKQQTFRPMEYADEEQGENEDEDQVHNLSSYYTTNDSVPSQIQQFIDKKMVSQPDSRGTRQKHKLVFCFSFTEIGSTAL